MMLAALVLVVILGTAAIGTAYVDGTQSSVNSFVGHPFTFTYPNQIVDKNVSFSFEQSVQGNGYYVTYKYAKMGNTEFKDYAHGSGSLDNEAILTSYNLTISPICGTLTGMTIMYRVSSTKKLPMRCRSDKDLNRNRLLCSQSAELQLPDQGEDWVKNRLAGTSMQNEVEYAHKLDKDLSVLVKDFTNFTYDPLFTSNAITQMNIKEDVGEGKIHIGVLQANSDGTEGYRIHYIDGSNCLEETSGRDR